MKCYINDLHAYTKCEVKTMGYEDGGIYGLMIGLKGWGIYGSNGWGSYGKVSYMLKKH